MDSIRDEPVDDAVDQEERPLQQHTLARVRAALEPLPVDLRELIVLHEIEGMSYKEIAAVLRIPIGGVMSRLAHAHERLMAVLKLAADGDAAVSCEDVGRDLDAHVDREFGGESAIVVGDHLSGCAACASGSPSARRWAGWSGQRRIIRPRIVCARVCWNMIETHSAG